MTTVIARLVHRPSGEEIEVTGDTTGGLVRLLASLDPSKYPYLARVDPFGITTFNRLQMELVIPELTRLKEEEGALGIQTTIDRIINLARQCSEQVHLYLEFEGD